jgi:hypothetical protein
MITVVLIITHAFGTNKTFTPDIMYMGTLIADVIIIKSLFGCI